MKSQSKISRSALPRVRALGIAAAVLVAESIWAVARFALGIPLQAPAGAGYPEPVDIGALNVAVATVVLSLVGWGALAVLERLTSHARHIWLLVALVAFGVSLGMPLSGFGISPANRAVLVLMHVAVAAVVIPVLYRTSPGHLSHPSQVSSTVVHGQGA
jgi:hypothetical protein